MSPDDGGTWTFEGEIARTGAAGSVITLVEGADFCLSGRNGDIRPGSPHGLFLLDSRFLSQLELRIDNQVVEPLGVAMPEPSAVTVFGRVDPTVVVLRHRSIRRGLVEDLVVRNHGAQPRTLTVEVSVDADFADVFEVKESRVERRGWYGRQSSGDEIDLGHILGDRSHETVVRFAGDDPQVTTSRATWHVTIGAGDEWRTAFTVSAVVDGAPVTANGPHRSESWTATVPKVGADDGALVRAVRRAAEDLGSLRIVDPDHPERVIVAAGAPWFMSPFGRDSLITAWMALPIDPALALGVLETLARTQGEKVDTFTEEQPGRIFHEMRFGSTSAALGGSSIYYGTVDATPLFVMLLGELRRWGLAEEVVDRLLPHADRALEWIVEYGDRDGDGFIEYSRINPSGLANQGWKDSWDGIRYGDGSVASAPLAVCEVQGYAYAAYLARAHFAREVGDHATERRWAERAGSLKEAFNRDFWLPDRGWFALALDRDKRPVDSLASNQGHCLWTGIVDVDKAEAVADALLSPSMFSGWGVRTLAADERGYNPLSYHCGSVWPHDNALIAAGLVRYGFVDHAHRIMRGMLDVADANHGRLPELFSGLSRDELAVPASYPTSCEPQAWAAAAPLLFLRLLLRLDPWLPEQRICLSPSFPDWLSELRVEGIPLGGVRVDIAVDADGVRTNGFDQHITIDKHPRAPLTTLLG